MPPAVADPHTPPLALTMGDPSGIGPDITLAMWRAMDPDARSSWFVLACPDLLAERARRLGFDVPIDTIDVDQLRTLPHGRLSVLPLRESVDATAGTPDSRNAAAILESIERGVSLALAGSAGAIVTNPIAKVHLYEAGFGFPGHTEFLADLAARHSGAPMRPVMMLAGPSLRAVPVTIHIPLRAVFDHLSSEEIVATGRIVAADLAAHFGIDKPRLAVAGLNPHAGESGALGTEDETVIAPAVAILREAGIDAAGPLPADTMFHADARQRFDAALCMYHDQALIPAKALAFDETVNVTLGLPFIRTSPDHGTAFDIAGTGQARSDSLMAAMRLARQMADRKRAPAIDGRP